MTWSFFTTEQLFKSLNKLFPYHHFPNGRTEISKISPRRKRFNNKTGSEELIFQYSTASRNEETFNISMGGDTLPISISIL